MNEIVEMIYHWHQGGGVKGISHSLGLDRDTVRKYVRMAQKVGMERSILCVMVGTMIGTKILKRVRVSLFQGIKKLKMASLKESLRDYRRNMSNHWVNQTPRNVVI